jgi:CheY-like chemotaxis protein
MKIVVVDDERDVQALFEQRFRREIRLGLLELHFAFSGEDALTLLEDRGIADIVLILSDINMPGMNGLELLKAIKARYPLLKVYMVTAYGDEATHQRALESGCDDYLTKPIDFTVLKQHLGLIERVVESSMGHSILIIDDDASTRTLLTSALQAEGYETVTAENGADAVRRLVELKPCVILLDFDMPVMDGHDFREVQKRVAPDVPIICLTGAADPEMTARRVGASSVHQKPLDVDALRSAVAELCRQPHAHRHTPEVESSITPGRDPQSGDGIRGSE